MRLGRDRIAAHEREGLKLASVLLGWELGDDPGHVRRLAEITRCLLKCGHLPYIVVRDVPATSLAGLPPSLESKLRALIAELRSKAPGRDLWHDPTDPEHTRFFTYGSHRDFVAVASRIEKLIDDTLPTPPAPPASIRGGRGSTSV